MNSKSSFTARIGCPLAVCLFLASPIIASANPGSPLLKSPYPGSRIIWQQKSKYIDNVHLLLSTPRAKGGAAYVDKTEKLQGSLDSAVFSHRESDSEIEIHESYRQALLREGYTLRFVCPPGCYPEAGQADWDAVMEKYAPPISDGVLPVTNISYLAASKDQVNVMILAGAAGSGEPPISVVTTVVSKAMDLAGVAINPDFVSANDIKARLQQDGRIALYGIYFDTGKADLKPNSRPVLDEIAHFLQRSPATHLYVVGHTDDSGSYQHNIELSDRRAASVVADLVKRAGIDPARLLSRGVGPLAPLDSNHTERGKSRNRRVELIEKLQ